MYEYVDAKRVPIAKGQRVRAAGEGYENDLGVIESISDPDGDVDDEGRSVQILPTVTVRFDDGDAECFQMPWTGKWWDDEAPFQCEDIEVVSE